MKTGGTEPFYSSRVHILATGKLKLDNPACLSTNEFQMLQEDKPKKKAKLDTRGKRLGDVLPPPKSSSVLGGGAGPGIGAVGFPFSVLIDIFLSACSLRPRQEPGMSP